jgi:hypothetical protein
MTPRDYYERDQRWLDYERRCDEEERFLPSWFDDRHVTAQGSEDRNGSEPEGDEGMDSGAI